jgi:hypothetical protein
MLLEDSRELKGKEPTCKLHHARAKGTVLLEEGRMPQLRVFGKRHWQLADAKRPIVTAPSRLVKKLRRGVRSIGILERGLEPGVSAAVASDAGVRDTRTASGVRRVDS